MARRHLWWVGPPMFVGLVILISLDSIQWVFLARVQWVAWFALVILPALAHTLGRELLIGAYDLDNSRAGFHVGFLLVLVGTSIVDTAYITQKYGQERLHNGLRDLADRDLAKLPKEILVIRINAFPAAECSGN
jgi:hypothetical protein